MTIYRVQCKSCPQLIDAHSRADLLANLRSHLIEMHLDSTLSYYLEPYVNANAYPVQLESFSWLEGNFNG